MNDLEFRQRAYANPRDDSPEFLRAAAASTERRELLERLLAQEERLEQGLKVPAPDGLRERLLDPDSLASGAGGRTPGSGGDVTPARSRSAHWTRLLPVAACLVVAVGVALALWPESAASDLEREIFDHFYAEIDYLDRDSEVSLPTVNRFMAMMGGRLEDSQDMRETRLTVVKDCWIARQWAVHMVLRGDRGAVTIMVIPNSPVNGEFSIDDERFEGIVTPISRGNLVVLGEKQEPLSRYRNLIANNLSWN